ncbi:acyltransferase family protein [Sandarakinorhabdus sp. DWP1-3-1]|uniref:acyltransferase family protein n=1 Tax=Sandarakinorhabdus sp. DWP1-3-1 TaxID=2804627 RepID=UPI003CEB9ABB
MVAGGTIPALQSLRGIAALVVLLHHASFVFATSPWLRGALETALNAHAAVVLFFVLSGFVLCRSLAARPLTPTATARFWWRRAWRIYPAVFVAVMLAAAVLALLAGAPTPHASAWYMAMLAPAQPDPSGIALNLAVLKTTLVPPLWSVRVELMMSLLMPLVWLVARGRLLWPLLALAAALCLGLGDRHAVLANGLAFAFGAALARNDAPVPGPVPAIAATIVLLLFRRLDPAWRFEMDFGAVVPTLVESLAAAVIVGHLARAEPPRWLVAAPLVGLGDISYSLYVLHFPILVALATLPLFAGLAPDPAALLLMALTLAATLPLAMLSYSWIERPGIAIGRGRHAG